MSHAGSAEGPNDSVCIRSGETLRSSRAALIAAINETGPTDVEIRV